MVELAVDTDIVVVAGAGGCGLTAALVAAESRKAGAAAGEATSPWGEARQ